MLNKLPEKAIEGILALLEPKEWLSVACVSPRMWKIVEETPKKYGSLHVRDIPMQPWGFCFAADPISTKGRLMELIESAVPLFATKIDGSKPLIAGCQKKFDSIVRSAYLRLFLTNSTIFELRCAPLSYGLEFWASLNMKVTRISYPDAVRTITQIQRFIDHFKPAQFIMLPELEDTPLCQRNPTQFIQFLRSPVVCSMEKLHIRVFSDYLDHMHDIQAKDLFIDWQILYGKKDPGPKIGYLTKKIMAWLWGDMEIDKLQIWSNLRSERRLVDIVLDSIERCLPRDVGKIVRKDEDMQLIVRASDGQALIAFLETRENRYNCFYLIRCDYNFRKARPADSYERNAESLRRIRNLMRLASRLSEQNAELSGDVMAKLTGECIKFNAYNKGATKMDLMTDALWRPKSVRRSPWGWSEDEGILRDLFYPIDISTRHAYDFTKAFEERGVLPEIDEFKPASEEEIDAHNSNYRQFVL